MARVTNNELQLKCDIEKYNRGYMNNCDNSGMMDFCAYCEHSNGYACKIAHDERVAKCVCAKAYRKMAKERV